MYAAMIYRSHASMNKQKKNGRRLIVTKVQTENLVPISSEHRVGYPVHVRVKCNIDQVRFSIIHDRRLGRAVIARVQTIIQNIKPQTETSF